MKRLYDTKGHLKPELVHDVLNKARLGGKLPNISEISMKRFGEKLAEKLYKFEPIVGKQVTTDEVKFLIRKLVRDKHDGLMDKDIQTLEEVILDPDAESR